MTYLPTLLAAGGRGVAVPYAATITPDLSAPLNLVGALTGPATIANVTPASGQGRLVLVFQQDATGGRALTWGSLYRNAPQPGQSANALDAIEFIWNGSAWVTGAADVATGGGGTTPAWWSSLTFGSGATSAQIATNTTTIQGQIDAAAALAMTGMKFQTAGGVFQGGATAPGGGTVVLPAGVIVVTNLVLGHRVGLVGQGWGTVLFQAAGSVGPVVSNRFDGTVHAKYCRVAHLAIHGNRANQGSATGNHGVQFTGDQTFNYNSTLDEDWDSVCRVEDVHILLCAGHGVFVQGGSQTFVLSVKVRSVDGNGIRVGFDTHVEACDVGWAGLAGFYVDGDSTRLSNCKSWYSGRAGSNANGHGFYWSSNVGSGSASALTAQDNYATGFLVEYAKHVALSSLEAQDNDYGNTSAAALWLKGAYACMVASLTASCRYSGGTGAGQQDTAVQADNGAVKCEVHAGVGLAADHWGTATPLTASSDKTNNAIYINGVKQ